MRRGHRQFEPAGVRGRHGQFLRLVEPQRDGRDAGRPEAKVHAAGVEQIGAERHAVMALHDVIPLDQEGERAAFEGVGVAILELAIRLPGRRRCECRGRSATRRLRIARAGGKGWIRGGC